MGLWDEEPEEFRDIPDEVSSVDAPPVQVQAPVQNRPIAPARPQAPQVNDFEIPTLERVMESYEEDEDDYTEVLNDANLRIEQGRLYQMIMNHDLFDGMDADPRAVQNVQKEIRKFARERMEIMLGMRQEKMAAEYANYAAQVANPFNDLQTDVLKKLASKITNGASDKPEANEVASVLRQPKRQTLNPIGGSTVPRRAAPKLPARPQAPITRQPKVSATVAQIAAEEGVPIESLELEYTGIGKPVNQLTAQELENRRKQTALRVAKNATVKSATALPMATPEQQEFLAVQRAAQIGQAPGMAALLSKVKDMPIKNP